jgi:outer membrane immunogenic protein
MKKIIIGIFGIVALTSAAPAVAGDFSAAPSYSGPMTAIPAWVYNWTGFYVGGHIGEGWTDRGTTVPGSGAFPVGAAFSKNDMRFLGGLQGGYNWQVGNFVFGVEGEYTWEDVSGSAAATATTTSITSSGVSSGVASRTSELGLATARIGYAASNWLYYFKGGGAWGHDSIGAGPIGGTPFDTTSTSIDRAGWVVGGGIEWGFAPNWSAMLEYNHVDFGSTNITIVSSVSPTAFARSTETIDIIKAGINYRFNGGTF